MNPSPPPLSLVSEQKLQPRHRERLAVVYVRQSTPHQVQRHRESTQVQYSLVSLAERLGWPRERIVVIDDDLGLSAASAQGRQGFQRLLSEVALEHVGLVLGVEMSRLARSCKDWYQLLEVCALFGTLIGDLDGLYDPSCYNDRLLLGLKGTMSEAELHILRQRMRQGALNKARRGELVSKVPSGYVRRADGEVILDPDEQAQATVRLVFAQFRRLGSASGVLRHMAGHGLRLPVRVDSGAEKGQLQWRPPSQNAIRNLLRHPMYAGAYVYGRTTQKRHPDGQTHKQHQPRERWQVLLHDRYPAYINWAEYEQNQAQLAQNRSTEATPGTARRGRALLAGLVVCGGCGYRMTTRYQGKANQPRYCCSTPRVVYGGRECPGLLARALDDEITRLTLLALAPSAVEVSLQVAADLHGQREQAARSWQQRLERAHYEAERARRQYEAVEPENRLVARTLEAAWEEKLRAERELREDYDRFVQQQPRVLTGPEQERIRQLAADLPGLWQSATTTDADRKQVLRQVIERVTVVVEKSEWVEATVLWVGGHQTTLRFRRAVGRVEQLSCWEEARRRIAELKGAGHTAQAIADQLNSAGYHRASGKPFTAAAVRDWLSRYGAKDRRRRSVVAEPALGRNEWFVSDLARELDVNVQTIHGWIRHRKVEARQIGGPQGRWVVRLDAQTRSKLLSARRRPGEGRDGTNQKGKV